MLLVWLTSLSSCGKSTASRGRDIYKDKYHICICISDYSRYAISVPGMEKSVLVLKASHPSQRLAHVSRTAYAKPATKWVTDLCVNLCIVDNVWIKAVCTRIALTRTLLSCLAAVVNTPQNIRPPSPVSFLLNVLSPVWAIWMLSTPTPTLAVEMVSRSLALSLSFRAQISSSSGQIVCR